MIFSSEKLDDIKLHFILCTERTGSSLLSLMLNLHPEILSPSEEPFALYFHEQYKNKLVWTERDVDQYVDEFFALAEKNTDLYFSNREVFKQNLKLNISILNWHRIVKLTYLHFIDLKEKSSINFIVDKQIKYFFHLKKLQKIFPDAKFIVLVRDVRDNVVSKANRKLNWNQHPLFLGGLWQNTYKRIHNITEDKRIIIRYEDFMLDSKTTLIKICNFLNVSFSEQMLETEGKYLEFIESKKDIVDPIFIEHLLKFHSGLSKKSSGRLIGQYKNVLSENEVENLEKICFNELKLFDYEVPYVHNRTLSIKLMYFKTLSKLYRSWLLQVYLLIPFRIKIFIKRLRSKKVAV